jgi:hypothetical protein
MAKPQLHIIKEVINMTLEEALKKVENKDFKEADLLEYFGVKSKTGLEVYLEDKLNKPIVNNDFIISSFKFIYDQRLKDNYNPVEEDYLMTAMILKSFYMIDSDELKIIADVYGAFRTVFMINDFIKDIAEIKYFKSMYKQYVDKNESVSTVLKDSFKDLNNFLISKTKDLDIEDLKKMQKTLEETMGKLKE